MGRRHQATDHRYAGRSLGNALGGLLVFGDKRGILDQIARRITTDRQLGKHHQLRPGGFGALREIDDLLSVAGEITDGGVDLGERDLPLMSVMGSSRSRQTPKLDMLLAGKQNRRTSGGGSTVSLQWRNAARRTRRGSRSRGRSRR